MLKKGVPTLYSLESDENIGLDCSIFNLRTRMYHNICLSADLVRGYSAMEREFDRGN